MLLVLPASLAVVVALGVKPASLLDIRRCFLAGLWLYLEIELGSAWPVSSEISSGLNSSQRPWMTVLRPLEFVNFPSKDAMEAIFCIIFTRVFLPTGTALYQIFDVGLSSGVGKKFPERFHLEDDVRHTQ